MIDENIIPDELFVPATDNEYEAPMRQPVTYWQDAWKRFAGNKVAIISAIFIVLITLLAILIPVFSRYAYDQQIRGDEFIAPFTTWKHLLGTDNLGRDMLVRLMIGSRISLLIGIVVSILVVVIGVLYGTISAYFGGLVDTVMMRIVDILYAVPTILVIIILRIVLKERLTGLFEGNPTLTSIGPGLVSIFIAFSLLYWLDMARMVRGQILSVKQLEYVNAARALGAKPWRIMTKHLIPNCIGIIIVTATLNIPVAIFTEAFLSFMGLGVSSPMASLGSLANDGVDMIYSYPHMLILPSVLISLIILSFNLVGDGLRDALDPRMKNKS